MNSTKRIWLVELTTGGRLSRCVLITVPLNWLDRQTPMKYGEKKTHDSHIQFSPNLCRRFPALLSRKTSNIRIIRPRVRHLESWRIWGRFRWIWSRFRGFEGLESQSRIGGLNSADWANQRGSIGGSMGGAKEGKNEANWGRKIPRSESLVTARGRRANALLIIITMKIV